MHFERLENLWLTMPPTKKDKEKSLIKNPLKNLSKRVFNCMH